MRTSTTIMAIVLCLGWAMFAHSQDLSPARTWALGWDNGLGMRHLLSDTWGIGLQVDPGISDRTTEQYNSGFGEFEDAPLNESESKDILVGVMLFKEKRVGKHFGVGPYCRASYSRSVDERRVSPVGNPYLRTERSTQDIYGVDVGVRPTFRFEEWLVLETRFGLSLNRTNYTSRVEYDVEEFEGGESTTKEWNLDAFGTNLGPGAVMQFMVYLW